MNLFRIAAHIIGSKRILVLDDDKERHNAFDRIYEDCLVEHAYTYSEFVNKLNYGKWDLIHLDHDLGDHTVGDTWIDGWGSTREYNGKNAVDRVCELDVKPNEVIVHSINPPGAKAMCQSLTKAGIPNKWEPYGEI
jgi:hypothetical protein